MAKRFALSFGLDAVKNREAITALHRAGILYAVSGNEIGEDPTGPPANLPFLEILTEFTNKLLKQDKRVVLQFLDRRIHTGKNFFECKSVLQLQMLIYEGIPKSILPDEGSCLKNIVESTVVVRSISLFKLSSLEKHKSIESQYFTG